MIVAQNSAGSVQYENTYFPSPTPTQGAVQTPVSGAESVDLQPLQVGESVFSDSFTLLDFVELSVAYAFIGAAALSAVFVFVGGIIFILSGGDEERIKQAVNTIRYSIIGLVITILSFLFITIVGRIFGLNFISYLSADKIRGYINRVVTDINDSQEPGSPQDFEIRP